MGSNSSDDVLVVPAGTEIRVEFAQTGGVAHVLTGKVVVPVRVGWTTAIPATSKVIGETHATFVVLTSITIGDVAYKVKTNLMSLFTTASGSELRFTLAEPLQIPR